MTNRRVKCPRCGGIMRMREVDPKGWECPKCHKWVSNHDVSMADGLEEIPNGVPDSEPGKNWDEWYRNLEGNRRK